MNDFHRDPGFADALASGALSRRELIQRGTALGIGAAGIAGMLVAADKADASDLRVAQGLAGGTVNLLIPAEGAQLGVQDKIADMKKTLGVNVKMTALAVGPLNEKLAQSVKLKKGNYDAISVLGFTVAQFVGGGNFMPLNSLVKKLPASYGFPKDFAPSSLKYTGYFDTKKQAFGGPTLYLIPGLYTGPIIMYYRKDLLAKAGVAVPTTWEEYLAAAAEAQRGRRRRQHDGGEVGRRVDVPGRLVQPVQGHGRPPHERVACGQELHTPAHEPRGGRCAAEHGRLREGLDAGRPVLRLHRLDQRIQRRQDGDDVHVVDDRAGRSTTRSRPRSPATSASR